MNDRIVPRYPADNRLFQTDQQRDLAGELRALIDDLEGGVPIIGTDVLDILNMPRTIGDPVALVDSALHVATALGQRADEVLAAALRSKSECRTVDAIARLVLAIVLRVQVAKLEKAPA
jgi:hypothetical protein